MNLRILSICAIGAICGQHSFAQSPRIHQLLLAIRTVESGGDCSAVGDGGRSIGPYQIQRAYYRDSGVPGHYCQVRDRQYAERVMLAYWQRYAPQALASGDWQTLARIHNGGPAGHRLAATRSYWVKVRRAMQ